MKVYDIEMQITDAGRAGMREIRMSVLKGVAGPTFFVLATYATFLIWASA